MIIYYEVIVVLLLGSFFHRTNIRRLEFIQCAKKKMHKICSACISKQTLYNFILFTMIFLIAALRATTVGNDLREYKIIFDIRNQYTLMDSITGVEPFFLLLNNIIGRYTDNFQMAVATYSVLTLIGPFYLIKRYSNNPYYSMFLYIVMGFQASSFSGIRTAIALSILCFSLSAIFERKPVKFLMIVFLASMFHRTAIVFVVVYFLYSREMTKMNILIHMSGTFLLYLLGEYVFKLITKIGLFRKYTQFIVRTGSITYALVILAVFFISLYFYKGMKRKYGNVDFLYNTILFAFTTQILGAYNTNIMRLTEYFYIYAIVLIPNAFDTVRVLKYRKFYYVVFTIIMIVQYLMVFKSSYGTDNYIFFWK